MATTKITITLPDNQLEQIRQRVAEKEATSISGFVQRAVQKSRQSAAEFQAMLDEVLLETGGPPTQKELDWAHKMLKPQKRGSKAGRRRKAA